MSEVLKWRGADISRRIFVQVPMFITETLSDGDSVSSLVTTAGDGSGCRFVLGAKRDIAGGGAGRDAAGLASPGS